MATIKFSGGDLGSETMRIRCDLPNAAAGVLVEYTPGEGWQPTPYQSGDARGRLSGLVELGKQIAAQAVELPEDQFECEAEAEPDTE